MNGSAARADIDTGVAVAVMRGRFDTDLSAVCEMIASSPTSAPRTPHGDIGREERRCMSP
jgi:hypothetical protein